MTPEITGLGGRVSKKPYFRSQVVLVQHFALDRVVPQRQRRFAGHAIDRTRQETARHVEIPVFGAPHVI